MSRKPCVALLVCLLFAAIWLVGCRDTHTPTPPPPTATPTPVPTPTPIPSPQEMLQSAFAWHESHPYRCEMDLTEIISGEELEEDLKINMYINAEVQSPDRTQGTLLVSDGEIEYETRLVIIGDVTYIENPQTGTWSIDHTSEPPLDLEIFMSDESDIQDLQLLEPETIAGIPAHHLSGRVTLPSSDFSLFVGDLEVEMQVNYWICQADGRLLQAKIEGKIDLTYDVSLMEEISVTMRVFELDAPLEITAPETLFSPGGLIGALLPPLASDDAQGYLERGLLSFEDDRIALALAHFTRAIELDPDMSQAYLYRALAQAFTERNYEAPDDFATYLSIHPEDAQAYFLRSLFYTSSPGRSTTYGCTDISTALELSPDFPEALSMQALCVCSNVRLGPERVAQAFDLFAQARALDAQAADPFYAWSSIYCFQVLKQLNETALIEGVLPQIEADITAHPELPGGYLVRAAAILRLREHTIQQTVDAWSDVYRYLQRNDCGIYPQIHNGFDRRDPLALARQYATSANCAFTFNLLDETWPAIDFYNVDYTLSVDPHFKAQIEQLQREMDTYSMYETSPEYLSRVSGAVLTQDGNLVATYAEDLLQFWSMDGEPRGSHQIRGNPLVAGFSPDGKWVATARTIRDIYIWDAAAWIDAPDDEVYALLHLEYPQDVASVNHYEAVRHITFSPDSSRVAAVMHPNIYQVWDTQTGERLFTFEFSRDVEGSAIPSQGSWIAVAYGNSAEVVDAVTGKRLFVVGENADPGYTRRIHYLAISPDGRLIAAAGRGNPFVSLWDSDTGALVFPMAGRLVGGGPLVFSPDSRLLAMACEDGVVRVWDTENYQELYMLGHRGRIDQPDSAYQVHVVAFSPDGRTLLTGGEDGTVRLWDVQSGVELAIIRVVKPDEGE